jgi:hypothetical protein
MAQQGQAVAVYVCDRVCGTATVGRLHLGHLQCGNTKAAVACMTVASREGVEMTVRLTVVARWLGWWCGGEALPW